MTILDRELLLESWKSYFGPHSTPQYNISAPGRVNLIGEHSDHQDFPVVPCAIDKKMGVLCATRKCTKSPNSQCDFCFDRIRNVDSNLYASKDLLLNDTEITEYTHHWTNYIIAAALEIKL